MKQVRIGIVGLGFMGTTHWGIYRNLKNAKVVALADVDARKRAGDVSSIVANLGDGTDAKKWDLTGVSVYDDALKLIADPNVDMVDICVPTPYHANIVVAALKAGKHVFCEKPLCRKATEVKAIANAVRKAKGSFNLGLCVRAWPEYRHAYEYYKSGKAGKMLSATFKRVSPGVDGNSWQNWYLDGKRSGGALLDMHVHDADQVNLFFGLPKAVSAFGAAYGKGHATDHLFAIYDYGDGRLVTAEGGWEQAPGATFEMSFNIVCEKATLKLDGTGYHIFPAKKGAKAIAPKVDAKAGPTGWHMELAYFVDCIAKGKKPDKYQTIDSVVDTMKLVFAEEKAVAKKGAVRV